MQVAIYTPRVNNNDDFVRFGQTFISVGAAVRTGDPIAEIETDKATFTVEAEHDGYLLGFVQPLGEMIAVGSVLGWMGDSADEAIPYGEAAGTGSPVNAEPTLKATLLLAKFGLNASDVPVSGERLSAQDVLNYAHKRRLTGSIAVPSSEEEASPELPAGDRRRLTAIEQGMVKTVSWHRDSAVPGYVEIQYSTEPWQRYAEAFQSEHKLLLNPVLALMAYRLVQLAREYPNLNATIRGEDRYQYASINLGFALQSGDNLYLLSLKDSDKLEEKPFVDTLSLLMRHGTKGRLTADQTGGVTVGFSSMARWKVARHMPILAPYTSLMVAHAHETDQMASLGATYDHRVLAGGQVAAALHALSRPED
jgi:pyruvate/2-oxoglutarate dehydrogenase complex dihydrolipoamide acyltransferase (E2) component